MSSDTRLPTFSESVLAILKPEAYKVYMCVNRLSILIVGADKVSDGLDVGRRKNAAFISNSITLVQIEYIARNTPKGMLHALRAKRILKLSFRFFPQFETC